MSVFEFNGIGVLECIFLAVIDEHNFMMVYHNYDSSLEVGSENYRVQFASFYKVD